MGRTLRADIIIGGKADNSFYALGSKLSQLGSVLSGVSSQLISFGEESIETYRSYEQAMLSTETALKTQYASTSELEAVMEQLDEAAMSWANDSRFETQDVANAISEAAHAGWSYEEILEGIPAAMNIALAGEMDLATGLEYLVDITNASGIEFSEITELTDTWAYAANRTSTDISEMGEAMQKMGATLSYAKGNMTDVAVMLGVLADNGTKGSEAGTLLRNTMIRLIAPTSKAASAMEDLKVTEDELSEIYADSDAVDEANALLEETGFSAYDAEGNLKSFLTIFEELNEATSQMTEEDRNTVLSSIFPTRTITGALALLQSAANEWDGLYEDMQTESEGYAEYAAETMESGTNGTLLHLQSVWNVLQTKTGESLSDDVSSVASGLSELVSSVSNMDETAFDSIVSGLEVVAVAGPALTIAGGALKLIGSLGLGGWIGIAAVGAAALAKGLATLDEANYEGQFGTMAADVDALNDYLTEIDDTFTESTENITQYSTAVDAAAESYENASTSLSGSLLTAALTDAELTSQDKQELYALGDEMREALIDGIEGNYAAVQETLALFEENDLTDNNSGIWDSMADTLAIGYSGLIAQAEELSTQLRSAMTSAFTDGALTSDEYSNIMSIIEQQNEIMALQEDAQNATERQKIIYDAQTLSLDGLTEITDRLEEQRQNELDTLDEQYWQSYATMLASGNYRLQNGEEGYTQADLDAELAELTSGWQTSRTAQAANFNSTALTAYKAAIESSDLADAWDALDEMADTYLKAGTVSEAQYNNYESQTSRGDRQDMSEYLQKMADYFGGTTGIDDFISYYNATGNGEMADELSKLQVMLALANGSEAGNYATANAGLDGIQTAYTDDYTVASAREQMAALEEADEMATAYKEVLADALASGDATMARKYMSADFTDTGYQTGFQNIVDELGEIYDLSAVEVPESLNAVHDEIAAYRLMFDETLNAENYRIDVSTETDTSEAAAALAALDGTQIHTTVDGDTTTLSATINAAQGESLIAYIDGDTENLSADIYAEDGQTLLEHVDGDTTALQEAINALDGQTITVSVSYASSGLPAVDGVTGASGSESKKAYAEGGRATEASIFGEDGAEWAIPEEHSERTANLLNAAREASGFTWSELLYRNGGLNAGGNGSWTLIYSPTIQAADATGVEQKLKDDKARLEAWLRDKQLHDEVEMYA